VTLSVSYDGEGRRFFRSSEVLDAKLSRREAVDSSSARTVHSSVPAHAKSGSPSPGIALDNSLRQYRAPPLRLGGRSWLRLFGGSTIVCEIAVSLIPFRVIMGNHAA